MTRLTGNLFLTGNNSIMNNFTPEEMIRFLYNEMTAEEAKSLLQEMENDWTVKEKIEVLREAMSNLDTLHYSPRPQAIHSILQYADATKPVEH
jgi:DUF438 domain-containing protein